MSNMKILLMLIVCGFLLFGCTGGDKKQPASSSQKPATTQPSNTAAPSGSSNTSGSSGSSGLTGLGYTKLLALGVPVECDVTITSSKTTIKYKMYMKGKQYRVEMPMSSGMYSGSYGCKTSLVTLAKNKEVYMGCDGGKLMPSMGCDWMKFNSTDSSSSGGSSSGSSSTPSSGSFTSSDLEKLPSTSFDCKAWTFDSTKFNTPGKVCTMEDLLGGLDVSKYIN